MEAPEARADTGGVPHVLAIALAAGALTGPATAAAPTLAAHTCPRGALHVVYERRHRCLSPATRKRIFRDLIRYQNAHAGRAAATYAAIAKRWRIPPAAVSKIVVEGAVKRWPVPAP